MKASRDEMFRSLIRVNQLATLTYVNFEATRGDMITTLWKIMQETGKYVEEYIRTIPEG